MSNATTVVVQPNATTVEVLEQNGEVGVVQATIQTVEVLGADSVDLIEVGVAGPTGATGPAGGEDEVALAKRTDFVTELLIYRGEAQPGTADAAAAWRVRRLTLGLDDDVTEEWANGSADFSEVWDDRASLSYS